MTDSFHRSGGLPAYKEALEASVADGFKGWHVTKGNAPVKNNGDAKAQSTHVEHAPMAVR
jgi:hypothetical protein